MAKAKPIPDHWHENSWEEKARENPLHAIMTTEEMLDAGTEEFSPEHLEKFFAKGSALFAAHVQPLLGILPDAKENAYIVEYGCGAGRILRSVVDAGYACGGVDISQTMLGHCERLVPEMKGNLYLLDAKGKIGLPNASASLVYSYAVVQHIESLAKYTTAFDEMCRILKPSGILAVQVNCEDFVGGDFNKPDRTENFEDHSLHTRAGERAPYTKHAQTTWSGVYIGYERLKATLQGHGVAVERVYYHNPKKLRAIWVVGRKAK